MAPKTKKRKRGRYHIENPTIDDFIWCSKSVAAANTVRCVKCNQAYHNKCSVQCGTTEPGIFKKCCDPSFASNAPQEEESNEEEDETSDDSSSDDVQDEDSDELIKESNASEAITKNDLALFAKSIKKSFKQSMKKSRVSLGTRMNTLVKSVNAATAAAKANQEELSKLRSELSTHTEKVNSLAAACTENSDKILQVQQSVSELQSSIDSKIQSAVEKAQVSASVPDIEQFYMELNDRQSRRKNLVLFKLADANDYNADLTYVNGLLSKTVGINLQKVKFRRIGLYDAKAKQPRPIIITFEDQEDLYKILKNKKTIYKNVDIRSDKTFSQRQYINKKVDELKELNKSNPSDPKILKFRLDVPYISEKPKNLARNQRDDNMETS